MYLSLTTVVNQLVKFHQFPKVWIWIPIETTSVLWFFFILLITQSAVLEIKILKKQKHFDIFSKKNPKLKTLLILKIIQSLELELLWFFKIFKILCSVYHEKNKQTIDTITKLSSACICAFLTLLTIHSIFGIDTIIIWSYADMIAHYDNRIKHCIIMLS
jgi:hypothetical protein